jgi:cytochrome c peroxidase
MTRFLGALALVLAGCSNVVSDRMPLLDPMDTPESRVGERLFRETRFSQLFFTASAGDVNARVAGDPVLERLPHAGGTRSGPFAGQTMSCASCHMVDDATRVMREGGGSRSYADFAPRTLVPVRSDGSLVTTRNTPTLVGMAEPRSVPELFHFDGEFATLEDLIVGGWTGRNFGWAPGEAPVARAHLAEVLKQDDGKGSNAILFDGLPFSSLLKGEDPAIPSGYALPPELRVDVATADNDTIARKAAALVAIYLRSLQFTKDAQGFFSASPYDEFLVLNGLPRAPEPGESDANYADRLAWEVATLARPKWVSGEFELHSHDYAFGPTELEGLRAFLARRRDPSPSAPGFRSVGNCVSCHAPPHFTDFKFHNTGETQDEYDSIHGSGAFVSLAIPGQAERLADVQRFLPPSAAHPAAQGPFRAPPAAGAPGRTDLGLWNVAFNPDFPTPQAAIESIVCGDAACDPATALPGTIGLFKTPGLRDLGHSDPYLHTGRKRSIEEVLRFYVGQAEHARAGAVRNADPEIARIEVEARDLKALAAFLRSLDEDYE